MRPLTGFALLFFVCPSSSSAQAIAAQPAFEVVSVRLSPAPAPGRGRWISMTGGPGTSDPTRVTLVNYTLTRLLLIAYKLRREQLSCPEWMDTVMFDITAKIPAGATRVQFRLMQQNLLIERFHLKLHRQTREMPVYRLAPGRNGRS